MVSSTGDKQRPRTRAHRSRAPPPYSHHYHLLRLSIPLPSTVILFHPRRKPTESTSKHSLTAGSGRHRSWRCTQKGNITCKHTHVLLHLSAASKVRPDHQQTTTLDPFNNIITSLFFFRPLLSFSIVNNLYMALRRRSRSNLHIPLPEPEEWWEGGSTGT